MRKAFIFLMVAVTVSSLISGCSLVKNKSEDIRKVDGRKVEEQLSKIANSIYYGDFNPDGVDEKSMSLVTEYISSEDYKEYLDITNEVEDAIRTEYIIQVEEYESKIDKKPEEETVEDWTEEETDKYEQDHSKATVVDDMIANIDKAIGEKSSYEILDMIYDAYEAYNKLTKEQKLMVSRANELKEYIRSYGNVSREEAKEQMDNVEAPEGQSYKSYSNIKSKNLLFIDKGDTHVEKMSSSKKKPTMESVSETIEMDSLITKKDDRYVLTAYTIKELLADNCSNVELKVGRQTVGVYIGDFKISPELLKGDNAAKFSVVEWRIDTDDNLEAIVESIAFKLKVYGTYDTKEEKVKVTEIEQVYDDSVYD